MCPWAARIRARRSLRPVSGALMDPLRPPERIHRLSRAAPTMVAALSQPRGERLRSEGTENALKAHLERAAVVAGGRVCRTECNRGPRAPKPPGPAARSPPAAPRSAHSVLSEIFGNVVFGCRDEAKRGKEGASKVSSGCPRVRSTTTCDLIMESPASAFLLRKRPSRAVPPYAYARRPPPEVPPAPSHRIALFSPFARLSSSLSSRPSPDRPVPPALDDHDCLPPRPAPPPLPPPGD